MNIRRMHYLQAAALGCALLSSSAHAQFTSGSTGADGALAPGANVTVPVPESGTFHFTTVTIPANVTVRFTRNARNTPVTILAMGDVLVSGVINVDGENPNNAQQNGGPPIPGGAGGPGGFAGGGGGVAGGIGGSAGIGPGGGAPANRSTNTPASGGTYGASSAFQALLPLFGGSGGGGGDPTGIFLRGGGGGGGGGAILIASSTKITVNGTISANGGATSGDPGVNPSTGHGGSGGAIRLVSNQILGSGSLQARNVTTGGIFPTSTGRIRLEAFTLNFAGSMNPIASQTFAPGPINSASVPALINLPTLAISSIGNMPSPAVPAGSYGTADVALPVGTTNPVVVNVAATNMPVGSPSVIRLKLIPRTAPPTVVDITASQTGTFASSTASGSLTFPAGQISIVQAFATFTLTGLVARLLPEIDGERVDRVELASTHGSASTLTLLTASGKAKRLDELDSATRAQVATALQAMRHAMH